MLYSAIRPALFALDPERAHALTLRALRAAGYALTSSTPTTAIECLGLRFPNRVGLAAGFDKNAVAVDGLGTLGFGFIEIGTVTPRPQAGQSRPRLFRFPDSGALLNRLGFPNEGAEAAVARLRRRRYRGIVGINIGKNADTPLDRAVDDYRSALRTVQAVADYIVVNVSSPNTAALRELQSRDRLAPLLGALLEERGRARDPRSPLPLLVKISPDLPLPELEELARTVRELALDGIVATNTTLDRALLPAAEGMGAGGISGRPLQASALRTVETLRRLLGPSFPIIGVGGIDSPDAALAMRAAGADLVQIYTGLVFRGPGLVSECVQALQRGNRDCC
jgi:dihydroorotate dehydrogenase